MYDSLRLKYDYVFKYFKDNNCYLLDKIYKNARSKLNYICECGNVSRITFGSFKNGNRCKKCGLIKLSNKQRLNSNFVKQCLLDKGYILLNDYINAKEKLHFKCSVCSREFNKSWNAFTVWIGCYHTNNNRPKGKDAYQWISDRKSKFENDFYKQKCYKLLKCALKSTKQRKEKHTKESLGYSYSELKEHIYNHPNWPNCKDKKWHIDHIFPIKAFTDYNIKDIKLINSLDNLRPILAKENLNKNCKYDRKEFKNWLIRKGIYE